MRPDVKEDMAYSANAFESIIWPSVAELVGGGELLKMENVTDSKFAKLLDMKAGIDGWQIRDNGMIGIASRIQVGNKAWNTFTIRMKRDSGATTEYEKRLMAVEYGKYVYPYFTIQAYIKTWGGPIMSVGISPTSEIISFIKNNFHRINRTTNAEFAVCPWDEMKNRGFKVKVKFYGEPTN